MLQGSVRKEGDRLRITAQLVTTADGYHVWTETSDRSSQERLPVQAEVSRTIANAVAAQRVRVAMLASAGSPAAKEARDLSPAGLAQPQILPATIS